MRPEVENKINEMISEGLLKPTGSLFKADGYSTQENKLAAPVILVSYRMQGNDVQDFLKYPQRHIDTRSLRCDVLNEGSIRNWSYRFLIHNWILVT